MFLLSIVILIVSKDDSLAFDIALVFLIVTGGLFFLIIVYFILTRGIKKTPKAIKYLFRRLKRDPVLLFNLVAVIIIGAFIYRIDSRMVNIEKRFGGVEKLKCSEDEVGNLLENSVVRIIGSFGEGSGFPISGNEIVTNYHVIEDEPSPKVVYHDGSIEVPEKIIGSKTNDIAILKMKSSFTPFFFSEWLNKKKISTGAVEPAFGEPVYAAGYPLGSTLPGPVSISKGSYTGERFLDDFDINIIQADISLEHGMSGGPLVNSCGQVLGVSTIGLSGTSLFIDLSNVEEKKVSYTDEGIVETKIDKSTPEGVVTAFYTYIKARNLKDAYYLLSDARLNQITLFSDWIEGYENTLQVELVLSRVDENNENKVEIKLVSKDWIDGELVFKYFQGYWIVIEEGNDLRLDESNITEIDEPDYWWFNSWEKPEWWD